MEKLPKKYEALLKAYTRTLNVPSKRSPRPIAIAPFGPCCVGKTTTMTYLAKRLPVVHINHDHIRILMRKRGLEKEQGALYKYLFIVRLAKQYLQRGYSVILDRDFGTNNKNVLTAVKKETRRLNVKFFLIHIIAPKRFVEERARKRKWANDRTSLECYHYSITHYSGNYKRLASRAIAKVDASKRLSPQLKRSIAFLKKEIGL